MSLAAELMSLAAELRSLSAELSSLAAELRLMAAELRYLDGSVRPLLNFLWKLEAAQKMLVVVLKSLVAAMIMAHPFPHFLLSQRCYC